MEIDNLINLVTKDIKEEWPTIYKIRYIYIELGKYLSKDTDFFFSVGSKLDELNLDFNQVNNIYNSMYGRKKDDNWEVICRSASYILHKAYEKVGIKSKLINTINDKETIELDGQSIEVNHWLLVVYDNDKAYFNLLSADLPYIKEGMKLHHFASKIPYKKRNKDGVLEQLYEGEEIKPSLLTEEETRAIDKEIGYLKYYYEYNDKKQKVDDFTLQYGDAAFLMLKERIKNNKWYHEILAEHTNFYNSLYNFINKDNKILSLDDVTLDDFSDNDIDDWINLLCLNIGKRISNITNIDYDLFSHMNNFDYDTWLKSICDKIYKIDDFSYTNWSKEMKKKIEYSEYDYNSIVAILDKTNALVKKIKKRDPKNFNELLVKLSYHFIDRSRIINLKDKEKFINNKYIAYKLVTLFPKIFSTNEIITPFNKREYSEQIVIIKEILEIMFPELNKNNSNINNYNEAYSPVFNRIQIYTIKNKETLDYSLIFNIVGDNKNGNYYFYYNPKKNTFHVADILEIYQKYIVVSERFKSILDDTSIATQKKR